MRFVLTTPRFEKRLANFLSRHPQLSHEVRATMQLVAEHTRTSSLRMHRLHGNLSAFFAVRVSREYRLVFALEPSAVIFIDIGAHDDVYR